MECIRFLSALGMTLYGVNDDRRDVFPNSVRILKIIKII